MFWCFPWYTPRSERIKLKSCRNLIEHYLGNFLKHQITLDQLSVNIYKGTGKVCDINFNCEALNELGKRQNWPIKVVESHMEDVTICIPWTNLFKHDSIFKINGLCLTVQPKARAEPVSSILKWILSNWAKSCSPHYVFVSNNKEDKKQIPGTGQPAKLFAESFNSILKRLKVKLENTKIRIEHVPKDIERGFALEFNIKNIDYSDESATDLLPVNTDNGRPKTYATNSYTNKKIKFEGVTFYMQMHNEPELTNTQSECNYNNDCTVVIPKIKVSNFFGEQSGHTGSETNLAKDIIDPKSDALTPVQKCDRSDPVLFTTISEQQGLTLKFNDAEEHKDPKIEIQTIGPFIIVLSPKDLDTVVEIIKSLQNP